jgi:hypothetical protein
MKKKPAELRATTQAKPKDAEHSMYSADVGSAYEYANAFTKQDFHTGVKSARLKSTKE